MEALAQLAALDHAHRRYPQAIEKYGVLYNYYGEHKVPGMQAVVLQGVGDVLRRQGDLKGARDKYQQGIALLSEPSALPILLNLTAAAGDVSLELRDHATAEGFFDIAQQIAGKLLNAFAKGDVLEKQGVARDEAGDHAGAIQVWKDASALCETFGYHERRRAVLEHLITAYKRAGQDAERRACEAELDAVRQAMKEKQS
jgi:tetratricopeptide (TPR) repeat protein